MLDIVYHTNVCGFLGWSWLVCASLITILFKGFRVVVKPCSQIGWNSVDKTVNFNFKSTTLIAFNLPVGIILKPACVHWSFERSMRQWNSSLFVSFKISIFDFFETNESIWSKMGAVFIRTRQSFSGYGFPSFNSYSTSDSHIAFCRSISSDESFNSLYRAVNDSMIDFCLWMILRSSFVVHNHFLIHTIRMIRC